MAEADATTAKLQAAGQAEATRMRAMAEAEATKAIGLAQAEAERSHGLAAATVIAAKGQAEAEAMLKKAEAFKQYNDAALSSMMIERLPEIVAAAAGPLSKIGTMTVLSTGGDTTGAGKISSDIMNMAAQSIHMVKGLTGLDLTEALKKDRKVMLEDGSKPKVNN